MKLYLDVLCILFWRADVTDSSQIQQDHHVHQSNITQSQSVSATVVRLRYDAMSINQSINPRLFHTEVHS